MGKMFVYKIIGIVVKDIIFGHSIKVFLKSKLILSIIFIINFLFYFLNNLIMAFFIDIFLMEE